MGADALERGSPILRRSGYADSCYQLRSVKHPGSEESALPSVVQG
jgi:hypothetical protein